MKECFYRLAVANPGAVEWYCMRKLEMSVALTRALLTQQLQTEDKIGPELVSAPGGAAAKKYLEASASRRAVQAFHAAYPKAKMPEPDGAVSWIPEHGYQYFPEHAGPVAFAFHKTDDHAIQGAPGF